MYTKLQDRIPQAAPQAPPGALTAHGRFYLVLLCSQPDTVRSSHCVRPNFIIIPQMYGFISVAVFLSFVKDKNSVDKRINYDIISL